MLRMSKIYIMTNYFKRFWREKKKDKICLPGEKICCIYTYLYEKFNSSKLAAIQCNFLLWMLFIINHLHSLVWKIIGVWGNRSFLVDFILWWILIHGWSIHWFYKILSNIKLQQKYFTNFWIWKLNLNLLSQILKRKIEKHLVTNFWFRILKEPKYLPFSWQLR